MDKRKHKGSDTTQIHIFGIDIEWFPKKGICTFNELPVAMMWVDTTLAGLMKGVQAMVGTERLTLALQGEGRKSVDADWTVISENPDFKSGFKAIASLAAVAGWGRWELVSIDDDIKQCTFRVLDSWEGLYQKALGVCWGSAMLAGKFAGYCSRLFNTNCWADQTTFAARGDVYDEFVVRPSTRSIEAEIEGLTATDLATRADMAVALKKLEDEIAERRRAEERLMLSEERYRQLVENASDIIYETDASGNIRFLNPSAEKLGGYTKNELIGKNYLEFLPPEYHQEQAKLLGIQFVKKIPTSYHETPFLTRDGSVIWLWQSVNLILDGERVMGFRVIARDITGRKQAEEELKERENTLHAITASARDAIIMIDDCGKITFWNEAAEQILGWNRSETLERNLHLLLVPESYREAYTRGIEHFRLTGQGNAVGKTLELTAIRKDKTLIPIELSLSAVKLAGKWHAVGILRDITDRKRSEAECMELDRRLQQAQKLESLGILAGGIAHDFNNLLMGVLGNLDLSLLDLPQSSRARLLIEKAMKAGSRAADLTRQMLAYSGKGRYVVGRVILNDLVNQNEDFIRAVIPKTVSLELSLTSQSTVIEADADQVKQVIMNIVTNAAEAIGEQTGVITLKTGFQYCDEQYLSLNRIYEKPPAGRFVSVEVSDTGQGMDEQALQRLFEPFYSTKFTGRGLGMSAVLGIMSTHNGAIFVDSTPGKGSTIRVMFPACEVEHSHADYEANQATGPSGSAARSGMVLVVDDEEDIREVCSVFVEHLGFTAVTASDGLEAVELFRKHASQIVCVLLDLTMPRLDGIRTYQEMTGIRKDIPVILSSGFSEHDISKRFSTMGLAGFIQKPYTLHDLKDKITHVLRGTGKRTP